MKGSEIIKHKQRDIAKHVSKSISITNKLLSANLRSLSILHIDDHSLFAAGIRTSVSKKFPNISIKHIKEGNKAFEYVKYCFANKIKIDLIITDLMHPGLNGIDFTKSVRELESKTAIPIPIIFITMHSDKSIIAKGYEAGCSKWLIKNVSSEEICQTINNLI